MQKINNIPDKGTRKRVVIIGGGFGGLKLAKKLRCKQFQIILLDKRNYHLFQPLLYQVATAGIEPSAISFPFRKTFRKREGFHIRLCIAQKVIPEKNILITDIGEIDYDYLVIATGSDVNFFGDQTLSDHTMQLKTTSDALYNRNRVLQSFEEALNITDEVKKKRLLSFVIVGGGPTGIELAGALAEMKKYILPKDYPELDLNDMKILIVDGQDKLLSGFHPESSKNVAKSLTDMGVQIGLKMLVKTYNDGILTFADGSQIYTDNVFWVAGVKANSLSGLPQEAYGKANRVLVDEFNKVKGLNNIFALGDTALMITPEYPNGHPQVVQPAIQQASLLAKNLKSSFTGEGWKKFDYNDKGSMATIGRSRAVAEIHGMKFHGFFAWILWSMVHLMSILGVKNKLFVLVDWMGNYISYDQSLRLLVKPRIVNEELKNEVDDIPIKREKVVEFN